jgi:5-deoxy-glucuronate isomerase
MGDPAQLLDLHGDVRLAVRRTSGAQQGGAQDRAVWLLVEGGTGRLTVDDANADVTGRADVFDAAGWSAWVAPGSRWSTAGDLRVTVVERAYTGECAPSRLIPPDEVAEETRGAGTPFERVVRTYLPTGPVIAGETLNPPGLWSSYPPHKHDTDSDSESRHEEVYVYRFDPPHGFGLAVQYDDARRESRIVRDGDATRISSGYHPVVGAPGYAMYYLWALAGDRHTLTPSFDPEHAWLA